MLTKGIVAIVAFAGVLILCLITKAGLLAGLIAGAFAALIAVLLFAWLKPVKQSGRREEPEDQPEEPQSDPLAGLRDLNLRVREDPYRDDQIVAKVEQVIDFLSELVPKLASKSVSSAKPVVNAVATTHLPNITGSFLRVREDQRAAAAPKVHQSLDSLIERLGKIRDAVDRNDLGAVGVEASVLQASIA